MFVPFITKSTKALGRRRGGGGGGHGGGGGGGGGGRGGGSFGSGKSSGSSGTGSSGGGKSAKSVSTPNLAGGRGSKSTAYGGGGGAPFTIGSGSMFAGRSAGGGTREQVYGTRTYGSGYPGAPIDQRGVGGLGFPFQYWPIVFGVAAGAVVGYEAAAYLHDQEEYGAPDNSSRPGGPMMQAAFVSAANGNTFHVLADNATVASLVSSIQANCTQYHLNGGGSSSSPATYSGAASDPQPETTVQYYRASSVALTLDGYNNTAALGSDPNAPPTPLPTSGLDTTLLNCLNDTIGAAVPLIDSAAGPAMAAPHLGALVMLWAGIMFAWRLA